jgi:hypothetical protein
VRLSVGLEDPQEDFANPQREDAPRYALTIGAMACVDQLRGLCDFVAGFAVLAAAG